MLPFQIVPACSAQVEHRAYPGLDCPGGSTHPASAVGGGELVHESLLTAKDQSAREYPSIRCLVLSDTSLVSTERIRGFTGFRLWSYSG